MTYGKIKDDTSDKNIAYTLQDNEADGPHYRLKEGVSIARGKYLSQFRPLGENSTLRVDGDVAGGHVDTLTSGKIKDDTSDKNIAYTLQDNEADGAHYLLKEGVSIARGKYLSQFRPLGEYSTLRVDGDVAGGHVDTLTSANITDYTPDVNIAYP